MDSLGSLSRSVNELKKEISFIKDRFEDFFLNQEDKRDIDNALKEEKEGRLSAKKDSLYCQI